jgi:F-type H+-transporting ATPase subunit epsilon
VTPEGLLLRDEVDEVIAPGEEGYFGVRPGHTPLMATLGAGELSYRKQGAWRRLTCFSGWCEVLPDRVNVLADIGERAADIDVGRAEQARNRAEERMKAIRDEAGYGEAHDAYVRAVTRLAVARKERGGA